MIKEKYHSNLKILSELPSGSPVNLVLSGGAEKGVAHLVLLEKLEELGIPIAHISACSAGSLVAAMYASGMRPQEILYFFKTTELFKYSWITLKKPGIFNSYNYSNLLEGKVATTFEALDIPITISTTNLNKGCTQYFNKGALIKPVLASCAIPGLFNPIRIEGELYSDGGVLDNFPIDPFKDSKLPLIGSYVDYPSEKTNTELNSTFKVISHASKLLMLSSEEHKFFSTTLTVCFPLGEFSGFTMKEVPEIYNSAKDYLEKSLA